MNNHQSNLPEILSNEDEFKNTSCMTICDPSEPQGRSKNSEQLEISVCGSGLYKSKSSA